MEILEMKKAEEIQNKKYYFVSPKLEVEPVNNKYYSQVLQDQFENPFNYLREDNDKTLIIGKKSKKPNLINAFQIGQNQQPYSHMQSKKNYKKNTQNIRLNKAPGGHSESNCIKMIQDDSISSNVNCISTNPTNNMNTFNMTTTSFKTNHHNLNSNVSNAHNYSSKNLRDYLDNNHLIDYIKEIEVKKHGDSKNSVGQIFKDVIENDCKLNGRIVSSKNKEELKRVFDKQESQLTLIQNKDIKDQELQKRLAQHSKQRPENLLIKRSGDEFRKKLERMQDYEKNRNLFYGDTYIDWQSKLRCTDKREKANVIIGGIPSIWSTISFNSNEGKEIIRQPVQNLTSKFMNSTLSEFKSNISLGPKAITQTSEFRDTGFPTKSKLNTEISFRDSGSFARTTTIKFKRESELKEPDYKSMILVGNDLLKIERENAMNIKGRKIVYNNYEKGKYDEELIMSHYDRVITPRVGKA